MKILFLLIGIIACHQVPFSQKLSTDDTFDFSWVLDEEKSEIQFTIDVQTTGWAALSLSSNGKMINSDMFIGYVKKDGTPVVFDRFAEDRKEPTEDTNLGGKNDLYEITGSITNGRTKLSWKRKFVTGDIYDLPIIKGKSLFILGAYRTQGNPETEERFRKHTGYFAKQIILYPESGQTIVQESFSNKYKAPDFTTMDLTFDKVKVKEQDTDYSCKYFNIYKMLNGSPLVSKPKRIHAIAFEPIIDNSKLLHHFIIYLCDASKIINTNTGEFIQPNQFECVINPPECTLTAITWGTGSYGYELPPEVGLYWGDYDTYAVMLQIHYNNPNKLTNQNDSSGFKVYMTEKLRPNDLGVGFWGAGDSRMANPLIAGQKSVITNLQCSQDCLNKSLTTDTKKMTIFAFVNHGHRLSRKILLSITDANGKVDSTTFKVDSYEYNHQEYIQLKSPYQISKGSKLNIMCEYDTSEKTVPTNFGPGGNDEMCIVFAFYYPRENGPFICNVAPNGYDICISGYKIPSEYKPSYANSLKYLMSFVILIFILLI